MTAETPAGRTVAELGEAGVATVYEAYGRRGLVEHEWQVVAPGRRVAGPARTARCASGDNRAVHEALSRVQPGEVLVLAMDEPAPVALVGDLLATQAVAQGAVGILVDAAVRDSAELSGMPLAVLARWRSARGATKTQRGAVDVPVTVGGATIEPGDVVVLDDDGATAVSREDVDETLIAVRTRLEKEAGLRVRWARGELSYDAYGMRAEDEDGSAEGGMAS